MRQPWTVMDRISLLRARHQGFSRASASDRGRKEVAGETTNFFWQFACHSVARVQENNNRRAPITICGVSLSVARCGSAVDADSHEGIFYQRQKQRWRDPDKPLSSTSFQTPRIIKRNYIELYLHGFSIFIIFCFRHSARVNWSRYYRRISRRDWSAFIIVRATIRPICIDDLAKSKSENRKG